MTPDDLHTLREGWDFEAKLAAGRDGRGAVPASLWETYAAMANTFGGRILLGARELPDGTLEPVGIPDIDKVETDFWNQVNDRKKVSVNLLTRAMVNRLEIDGRTLLQIDVPKADRAHLPVHLNGSFEHNTFVRIGDGDRRADPETVRRLVADSDPLRDSRPISDFKLEDLDPASLRHFREVFLARRRGHPFGAVEGVEFLTKIQAWATDRKHGTEGPTRAGLLMFGRELAIRELYPHWHLSFQERDPEIDRWADRVVPDGTWEANVYNFYLRVYTKLVAGVKIPFALDSSMFRVDETDVHRALREAFINTLVHADYSGHAGVRIIRERGGYVFKNPGLPLIDTEQIWRGGISDSRNPTLLRLFALVELGEREGSGGPAIRRAWRAQHWQAPALRLDPQHGETQLELSQGSLLPELSVSELTAEWGARFTGLDELGRIAVVTAHAENRVSHSRLCELTETHSRDVTLKLQDLVRRGMLEPMGKGTGRSYRLLAAPGGRQRDLFEPGAQAANSRTSTGRYPQSGSAQHANSRTTASTATPKAEITAENPTASTANSPTSEDGSSPTTPERGTSVSMRPSLDLVVRSRRAAPALVRAAILETCASEFRTAEAIAISIDRTVTVVHRHVKALVAEGLLQLQHPRQPNHPKQAYRARPPDPP